MNKKKLGTMLAAMGLVGVVAIGGTLAYLSASTSPVTNTFAMGPDYVDGNDKIKLDLYETPVKQVNEVFLKDDENPKTVDETRYNTDPSVDPVTKVPGSDTSVTEGIDYVNVLPGQTLPKDPTVSLRGEYPSSRVFVKVSGIDAVNALSNETTVGEISSDWVRVGGFGDDSAEQILDGVYMLKAVVPASDLDDEMSEAEKDAMITFTSAPLFETIKIGTDATGTVGEPSTTSNASTGVEIPQIDVTAGVIQASGTDTADNSVTVGGVEYKGAKAYTEISGF